MVEQLAVNSAVMMVAERVELTVATMVDKMVV